MNIVVYCGANIGNNISYKKTAENLGSWIGRYKHTLVYGGGKVGLMRIVADEALKEKGEVIGVMPKFLVEREIAYTEVSEFIITDSMSERKDKMMQLGSIFIALPGGPGTLEEITEVISAVRVGATSGICILLNVDGYYNDLEKMYTKMVEDGFLTKEDREKIIFVKTVEEIARLVEKKF